MLMGNHDARAPDPIGPAYMLCVRLPSDLGKADLVRSAYRAVKMELNSRRNVASDRAR
jgi:hypothetical protein